MKNLPQYFLRGLLTLLPFGLTLYVLYAFLDWSEGFFMQLLQPLLGSVYVPGMGLVLGVVSIGLLGFVISQPFMERVFSWIELPFTNVPIIKSLYSSIKSLADYFAPQSGSAPQQVVLVRFPGQAVEVVGFLTRNHLQDLPDGITRAGRVAVYFPMSYMIGGYTVFLPREWVTPINMTVEEAMRSTLIAWMPGRGNGGDPPR